MTKFYSYENAFAMIDEALTPIKLTSVKFDSHANVVCYKATSIDGKEIQLPSDITLYANEDAFRNGNVMEQNGNLNLNQDEDGRAYHNKCTMLNGEPTEIKAYIVSAEFIVSQYEYIFDYDGYEPSQLYTTRRECLAYNDYQVADENGNITIRKGYAKMLQLTDEQKAMKDELVALMQKMQSKGVKFIIDCEDGSFGMLNTNGFKSIGYSYEYTDEDILAEYHKVQWLTNKEVSFNARWCDDSLYYQL